MAEYNAGDRDANDFRVKPGHTGVDGQLTGDDVWVLRGDADKILGYWESRHAAIGYLHTEVRSSKPEHWDPVCVPAESVRYDDVIQYSDLPDGVRLKGQSPATVGEW